MLGLSLNTKKGQTTIYNQLDLHSISVFAGIHLLRILSFPFTLTCVILFYMQLGVDSSASTSRYRSSRCWTYSVEYVARTHSNEILSNFTKMLKGRLKELRLISKVTGTCPSVYASSRFRELTPSHYDIPDGLYIRALPVLSIGCCNFTVRTCSIQ